MQIKTYDEFLNEKLKNLSLWVALFENSQFLGVYTSEEKLKKEAEFFYDDYVLVNDGPFQLDRVQRLDRMYIVFHEPFTAPYKAELTTDLGIARKISRELRSKHSWAVVIDKPARTQYTNRLKGIFDISVDSDLTNASATLRMGGQTGRTSKDH